MLTISRTVTIPTDELHWSFARSSGPGGQNVNKVNSKAILHWNIVASTAIGDELRARFLAKHGNRVNDRGEVVLSSQLHRDQPQNIEACRVKLRALILEVLIPPKKRRPTKPTRSSQVKRVDSKRKQAAKKESRRRVDE